MDRLRRVLKVFGGILLGALALVVALSITVATAVASRISSRDWPAADRARLRADLSQAARRVAEGVAKQRKDASRVRREARLAAEEMRREARRLAWEKRQQASRIKAEMSAAMREWKQSLKAQNWRNRNRI